MALKKIKKNNINPNLIRALKERKHSLGAHPIFPTTMDGSNFEEKMFTDRYEGVRNKCRNAFQLDNITEKEIIDVTNHLLPETINLEIKHKGKLEQLAIDMVMKEFDITEGQMDIVAELSSKIDVSKIRQLPDMKSNIKFDSDQEIESAFKEIQKRRFINAMVQGCAKKSNHMFHLATDEINAIDHRLMDKYNKIMSAADYSYFLFDDTKNVKIGGLVAVTIPKEENGKIKIYARAMTLPVLIHELIKGVMEVISLHGLPEKQDMAKFVLDKADFMSAEFWDMRLGVGIWEKFVENIDAVDFHLKHHIFCELVSLPAEEFFTSMREIIAGTDKGKRILNSIIHDIKEDIRLDNIEDSLYDIDSEDDDDLDLLNFDFTKFS